MATYNIVSVIDQLRASGSTLRDLAMASEAVLVDKLHQIGYDDEDILDYLENIVCDLAAEEEYQ